MLITSIYDYLHVLIFHVNKEAPIQYQYSLQPFIYSLFIFMFYFPHGIGGDVKKEKGEKNGVTASTPPVARPLNKFTIDKPTTHIVLLTSCPRGLVLQNLIFERGHRNCC